MTTSQPEKTKIVIPDAELQAAAKQEADINARLGKGEDGSYMILEMNRGTGEQTLISTPNLSVPVLDKDGVHQKDDEGNLMYVWNALVLPSRALAASWVRERGEIGFSYLILQAVQSESGEKTPDDLKALADSDAEMLKGIGNDA